MRQGSEPLSPDRDRPATLPAEHSQLMTDVTTRAETVLKASDNEQMPRAELYQLVDYLHVELLRQVVDEEWLLFRNAPHDVDALNTLRRQHLGLREDIDALTATLRAPEPASPAEIAAMVRRLLETLQTHLSTEETVLTGDTQTPSTAALGSAPHNLYTLVEGPTIDLDRLPGKEGVDAALGRLLRLHVGEEVELRASNDPIPLCRHLAMADPEGYGFAYLTRGPNQWSVQVNRRHPA